MSLTPPYRSAANRRRHAASPVTTRFIAVARHATYFRPCRTNPCAGNRLRPIACRPFLSWAPLIRAPKTIARLSSSPRPPLSSVQAARASAVKRLIDRSVCGQGFGVGPCSAQRSAMARVREDWKGASTPRVLSKRFGSMSLRAGKITRSFRSTTSLRRPVCAPPTIRTTLRRLSSTRPISHGGADQHARLTHKTARLGELAGPAIRGSPDDPAPPGPIAPRRPCSESTCKSTRPYVSYRTYGYRKQADTAPSVAKNFRSRSR
jgi:hypothetical protein